MNEWKQILFDNWKEEEEEEKAEGKWEIRVNNTVSQYVIIGNWFNYIHHILHIFYTHKLKFSKLKNKLKESNMKWV